MHFICTVWMATNGPKGSLALFRTMNCVPMLQVGIIGSEPLAFRTNGAFHLGTQALEHLLLFVAPTPSGNHPFSISWLNVTHMDLMSLGNCASGHIAKQFFVFKLQIPHCAIEMLNIGALTSTPTILEASPQHLLSDLGRHVVSALERGEVEQPGLEIILRGSDGWWGFGPFALGDELWRWDGGTEISNSIPFMSTLGHGRGRSTGLLLLALLGPRRRRSWRWIWRWRRNETRFLLGRRGNRRWQRRRWRDHGILSGATHFIPTFLQCHITLAVVKTVAILTAL